MSEHRATIDWQLETTEFTYDSYNRSHALTFDHDIHAPGAAAPANIPSTAVGAPGVDPEQAFVAALSSCHMLWFLHLACNRTFKVTRYRDKAVGVLEKRADEEAEWGKRLLVAYPRSHEAASFRAETEKPAAAAAPAEKPAARAKPGKP